MIKHNKSETLFSFDEGRFFMQTSLLYWNFVLALPNSQYTKNYVFCKALHCIDNKADSNMLKNCSNVKHLCLTKKRSFLYSEASYLCQIFDLATNFVPAKDKVLTLRPCNILYNKRKKQKMIRPLLDFKRESITMVCQNLKIPVYPDKSNRSVHYSRNRIRKQIIPSIKHFINPQVENSLFKLAQLLQKEQFFVYSLLKNTSVNKH